MNRMFILLLASVSIASASETPAVIEGIEEGLRAVGTGLGAPCMSCSAESPKAPGCLELTKTFCNDLHSAANQGNISLKSGSREFRIAHGDSTNGLSLAYVAYQEAKLAAQSRFSQDLRAALEKRDYFKMVRKQLAQKPPAQRTSAEDLEAQSLNDDIAKAWNQARNEVVATRMQKTHPDYHKVNYPTHAIVDDKAAISAKLDEEINAALWREHPAWKTVMDSIDEVRDAMIETVGQMNVSEERKARWIARLRDIKVRFPGEDALRIAYREGCDSTLINAIYYRNHNAMTVCAGLFLTQDPVAAITHEMAHSLDPGSQIHERYIESELGKKLKTLLEATCSQEPMSCEDWRAWKKSLPAAFAGVENLAEAAPEKFTGCLHGGVKLADIDRKALLESSKDETFDSVDNLARKDRFLKLVKKEIPKPDGTVIENSMYYNPCAVHAPQLISDPLDVGLQLFFVNEHRCSPERKPADRMSSAIEYAKAVGTSLETALNLMYGKFSYSPWMINRGYAVPVGEQFADIVGMHAFAKMLQRNSDVESRRHRFLAGSPEFCVAPSLTKANPEEAAAQRGHTSIAHPDDTQRWKDMLIKPVREALGCRLDFETKECSI